MADSTNLLNQIVVGQAQPAVPANELFASMSAAALFSRNESASSGLTWAYYGGYYNGIDVANGTLSLTASQANIYIVAAKATGVVSFSTATTNWNNTTDYDRLYRVTTSGSAATVWNDKRSLIGSSGTFTGGTLTSALNEAPTVTIVSSTTPAIGAAAGNSISITGTTTITGFDTIAAGTFRRTVFTGILQLTHNASSFILLTGANITTAAGDIAEWISLGSGNWRMTGYERATGYALVSSAFTGGTLTSALNEAPTVTIASSSTPAIGAAAGNSISITGIVTITGFDTIAAGAIRKTIFTGSLQLTHNGTSLILLTGADVTTAAGDIADWISLGSGNWRMTGYERASGSALAASASALTIKDEGSTLTSAPVSMDFVGAGVTATQSSGAVTVTIAGGGGSATNSTVIYDARIWRCEASQVGTTTERFGTTFGSTGTGTPALGTYSTASPQQAATRCVFSNTTTSSRLGIWDANYSHQYNTTADSFNWTAKFWFGTDAAIDTRTGVFVGFYDLNVMNSTPSTSLLNMIGMGADGGASGDTNWQIIRRAGSGAATKVDTGIARAINQYFILTIKCVSGTGLTVTVEQYSTLSTGFATVYGPTTYTTVLPASSATPNMGASCQRCTHSTTNTDSISFMNYISTVQLPT